MVQIEIYGSNILGSFLSLGTTGDGLKIYRLSDGYFAYGYPRNKNMREYIDSVVSLAETCKRNNAHFLFVQAPSKWLKGDNTNFVTQHNFGNQNADDLLNGLTRNGIPYIDLREDMNKDFSREEYHKLFFSTDHHWKQTTALWATGIISQKLNKDDGFSIDTTLFSRANYEQKTYPQHALGSQGRTLTLALAQPEDFSILIPKYKTKILYEIPSLGIREEGTFMLNYDMKLLNSPDVDLLHKDMYLVYNHGDVALIHIHNELVHDSKRVLLVKDSYADPLAPFLAMGVEDTIIIDLRHFTGSLVSFIKDYKPNVVIVLYFPGVYYPGAFGSIDKNLFDFR